jgi:acetylglutamate kinase
MASKYAVTLIYCFEKRGVLQNADDEHSVIAKINPASYKDLKEKKIIHSGMIPKLDNAFAALDSGVKKVIIGKAEDLLHLITSEKGTVIIS